MIRMFNMLWVFLLWGALTTIKAQDIMTIEDAIRMGLENNHNIQIARNEAGIGSINKSLGNAGFLPSLQVSGSQINVFEDNRVINEGINQGALSSNILTRTGAVTLDWTIFDGLRMFTTYSRLSELQNLGDLEARMQIESTITTILEAYYEIVRHEKSLGVLINSVETSEERYQIAQTKRELGSGSEYEVLLAQTDLNADHAAVIRQEVVLTNARMELIRLLNLNIDTNFEIVQEIRLNEPITIEEAHAGVMRNNHSLAAADIRARVSRLETREVRRERYPEIDFNVGYTIDRIDTDADLFIREQVDGLGIGLTARFTLFDGFNAHRRMQIAHINQKNNLLALDEQQKRLETLLHAEFKNYSNTRQLVELEHENLELAEKTLEIALERFSLATITSIELRESQRILLDTENRLITAQFEAKISETELLRLSGELGRQFDF